MGPKLIEGSNPSPSAKLSVAVPTPWIRGRTVRAAAGQGGPEFFPEPSVGLGVRRDWGGLKIPEIFGLSKPLWEILLRATVTYFALVFLVRVIPKRNAGHISPNDMLTLIVVGAMGTDAIVGGSSSLGEILLMIGLIVAWSYVFDYAEFRFPFLGRVFRHRQTLLIENGRLLRRNMRREMVTEEELMAVLRKEGIGELSMAQSASLEADGEISVVKKETSGAGRGDSQART